jgi:osmotically-inducible protein OsmY
MRNWWKGMVLAAALAVPAWAAVPGAQTTGAYTNGSMPGPSPADTVTTNVRGQLAGDRLLKGAMITVATSPDGVVTLVGDVPSVTAKTEAVSLARATPGVAEVKDHLRLDISSPEAPAPR